MMPKNASRLVTRFSIIMGLDGADLKETFPRPSRRVSGDLATRHEEIEQIRQRPGTTVTQPDKAEAQQPLQHVRKLGKLRLRPADDDEPQCIYACLTRNALNSSIGVGGLLQRQHH